MIRDGRKIASAFVCCGLCLTGAAYATTAPKPARIAEAVKNFADSARAASVTVRVTLGGTEVYSGSVGLADLEQHVSASPRTVYAIASMSKTFTAYCIFALAASGKLDLDATLGSLLPELKGPPAKVTIRQALVHTGGITDYEPMVSKDEARTYSTTDVLSVFNNKPLEFKPGSSFAYSNTDHYLLGLIIERVSGMSYSKALQSLIFQPFGLQHTAYGEREPIIDWRARGYGHDKAGKLINAAPWHESVPFAAGGIVSTTSDLDRFTEQLLARAGSKGPLEHAFDTVRLANGTQLSYLPISLAEGRFQGEPYYWHAGGIDGFLSFSAVIPSKKLTFTMFVNTFAPGISPYALYHRVVRIALDIPAAEKEQPLSSEEAAKYTGRYQLFVLSSIDGGRMMSRGFPDEFAYKAGHLIRKAGIGGDTETALLYLGAGRFASPDDPDQTYTFTAAHGKVHVMLDDITPWGGDRMN